MPKTQPPPLRIGILGAARIARKTIIAIQHEASGCEVVAVASRSSVKADDLINDHIATGHRHKVKLFTGRNAYQDLVASSGLVDALYIPLPTTLKKEWTIRALRSNKHVLVEKPVAPSATDYQEMIEEAKLVNRYLMDGTMFCHHPRTERLLAHISDEKKFGAVTGIDAAFTTLGHDDFMKNNIRIKKEGDFQGCIGDLGWYCIRLAQIMYGGVGFGNLKSAQVFDWKLNEEGVPIDANCLVTFQSNDADMSEESNHKLSFHCSYLHPWHQRGGVCGTKRTVEVMGFVNPKDGPVSFQVRASDITANQSECAEDVIIPCEIPQITLMWRQFHEYCKVFEEREWTEVTPSDEVSALSEISCKNQLVLDALMESIQRSGEVVIFPLEKY